MLDKNLLNKKLNILSEYVDELESLMIKGVDNIKSDKVFLPAVERYFQLTVDTMIDINVHIIREGNLGVPDDLESTFKTLGEFKVIDSPFAKKIAPIVGARNMLVHRYEKLDKKLFLENLKNNFSDLKLYMTEILAYIKKQS